MARKYTRDNRGRFASVGATARGGRLKTASGKKRATQTMKASGGERAGAIRGKVKRDPGAAGKIGKAKPAAAAAKPTKSRRKNTPSLEKVSRITERVSNLTGNLRSKSGVKQLNATEVAVRAKDFLTRKVGGMTGMVGKSFAQQQAVLRDAIATRRRYSTGTPNRNKPRRYNSLGQDRAREKAKIENQTAREKIAAFNKKPPAPKTFGRLMGRRELLNRNPAAGVPTTIKASRARSTVKKTSATAKKSNLAVRSRRQSKASQRYRREQVLGRTRSATLKKNPRIRRQETGMKQLSLIGKAKPLFRYRPVKR